MNNNNNIWSLPYGKPNASNTILEDESYFNEAMSPIFNNIKHPFNPHYRHHDIAGEANHNMLEGQPTHQKNNFLTPYTNKETNPLNAGLLTYSPVKQANIGWIDEKKDDDYHPYQIDPHFKALPNNFKNYNNPHKMKGPTTQVVPWDTFQELNKNRREDEYFNERNFQDILNHPFYHNMKPFLEQPFKHL